MPDRRHNLGDPAWQRLLVLSDPWLAEDPQRIGAALDRVADGEEAFGWSGLEALARRHRIVPLIGNRLAAVLGAVSLDRPPSPELHMRLIKEGRNAIMAEMGMLAELRRIDQCFAKEGLPFLVVKGLVLSLRCFKQMGWRTNRDIDLWIAPSLMKQGHAALLSLGFARVEPDAEDMSPSMKRTKDWVYLHRERGTVVELHHRLFDNQALCDAGMMERAVPLALFGQVTVQTLNPEDELAYLALHGAMHAWSRLKWLVDVAILARALGPERLEEVLDRQKGRASYVALHQALALCEQLFTTSRLSTLRRPWRTNLLTPSALHALSAHGACELEDTRFGTTVKNVSHYLLWSKPSYLWGEMVFDATDDSRDTSLGRGRNLPVWLKRPMHWIKRHS